MSHNINELGLEEFTVRNKFASEHDYDFHVVKATDPRPVCPECGVVTTIQKHGSSFRKVRDINRDLHRVTLIIEQRRWKASKCGHTFSDTYDSIAEYDKVTKRFARAAALAALSRPDNKVAIEFGMSATTIDRAFWELVKELDDKRMFRTPRVLGIDDKHVRKKMRTVFCDLEYGPDKKVALLEIKEARNYDTTVEFLKKLDASKVEVVTVDMFHQFHKAVRDTLPNAKIVVDKYHVVSKAIKALDIIRKRTRKADGSKLSKREVALLRKSRERLKTTKKVDDKGDLKKLFEEVPQLVIPYQLKEGFRDIFNCTDKQTALKMFEDWSASIPSDKMYRPFVGVCKMVKNWKKPIFNYFEHPHTNAGTESTNNLIEEIDRVGRGVSFKKLRAKALYGLHAEKPPRVGSEERTKIYVQGPLSHDWMNNIIRSSFSADEDEDEYFAIPIPTILEFLQSERF